MRWFLLCVVGVCCGCVNAVSLPARNGIERYDFYAGYLSGQAVGIVTHHTSLVEGQHSVDFLQKKGVKLIRVFSPEHGFRGDVDAGEQVGDYVDPRSGLPVISLYGKKKKPAKEDLEGIGLMLFDLQDVGVRFYTYLSTLHYVMEACAENGIPLIVMDRPNPNAFYVDGPVLKKGFTSFVGMHPVPVVYGMTIGEYARMINGEGWLKEGVRCDLTVVPCEGWDRREPVALPYAPSPNLPDSVSVMLYPSLCFFEGTVINEGRGTRTPFQVFGHPDLHDMPYSYTPRAIEGMSMSPKCQDQLCRGMSLIDRYEAFRELKRLDLSWLLLAYRNYRGERLFFLPMFNLLAGNDTLQKAIVAGKTEAEIRSSWEEEVKAFRVIRERYLLYPILNETDGSNVIYRK